MQGLFTLGWAWRTGRRPGRTRRAELPPTPSRPTIPGAWRVGAVQLVAAAWIGAATAGLAAVEWYSLSAAVGLLVAAGPRLVRGPSWPAWGPGLLVATVPSTVLAVVGADEARAVAVLIAAAAAMVAGARTCVRAPLTIGAGTALALAVGPGGPAAALAAGRRADRRQRAARGGHAAGALPHRRLRSPAGATCGEDHRSAERRPAACRPEPAASRCS